MVIFCTWHYPSSDSEEDVSVAKQQPKQTGRYFACVCVRRIFSCFCRSQKSNESEEERTKKKAELPSSLPEKDGDKKPEKKSDKKPAEEKKPEDTKPKQTTVVLEIRLDCDGCIHKVRTAILKRRGVSAVCVDADKGQVTVTGTMDIQEMVASLKKRLNMNVEALPSPKKDGDVDGGNKKEKEKEKEKEKKEKNKKSKKVAPPPSATVGDDKEEGGDGKKKEGGDDGNNKQEASKDTGNAPQGEVNKTEYYEYTPQPYPDNGCIFDSRLGAPTTFSDEDPHACSIM